jgi:formate--tetrahydrofolate ligase
VLSAEAIYADGSREKAEAEILVSGTEEEVPGPETVYSQKDGWWKDKEYGRSDLDNAGCAIFALSHALLRMAWTGDDLAPENLEALEKGIPNLLRHVSNMKNVYHLPCVVAINRFPTDTDAEIDFIISKCRELGVNTVLSTVWAEGGKGGEALAREVVRLCETENNFTFCYDDGDTLRKKIAAIVKKIYHGDDVVFTADAKKQLKKLSEMGCDSMPVCMAKTQYSFSDDQKLLGAPEGFKVTVRQVKVSAGAGFVVALTGEIMTMPGLPKVPAAEAIDVDENGVISGLF